MRTKGKIPAVWLLLTLLCRCLSAEEIVLTLDNRKNCAIVVPQRVETQPLPAGKYQLTLGGNGLFQRATGMRSHYAYVTIYGWEPGILACLHGKGDKLSFDLPEGAIVGAFLHNSDANDESNWVSLQVKPVGKGRTSELKLRNRGNSVDVRPFRVESPPLQPGDYKLKLGGEGVRQGGRSATIWYAFIVVDGVAPVAEACLSGKNQSLILKLPKGGVVSAFLHDSVSGDNSGSVTVSIDRVESSNPITTTWNTPFLLPFGIGLQCLR